MEFGRQIIKNCKEYQMKKFILTALAAFVVVCPAAFHLSAQTKKVTETSAMLYKISGKNFKKPSYLFGTIHIVCPNDMFSMEKLNGYFDQTDRLVMEIDMDNAEEMQSMGKGLQMPGGKTLKDFLTAEQFTKVDEMFKNYIGVSAENVKHIKPFFLATMVAPARKLSAALPAHMKHRFYKPRPGKRKRLKVWKPSLHNLPY